MLSDVAEIADVPVAAYLLAVRRVADRNKLPLDIVWLPCGHYTTAELPWKAIDAWKIATFFRKQFKEIK